MIPGKQASRHSRSNAHTNSQRLAACTQPAQVQVKQGPSTEREVDRSHSEPGRYWQLTPTGQGKTSILQWSITGHVNHTAGQVLCRGVIERLTQNEQINSVDFFFFGSLSLILLIFCLLILTSIFVGAFRGKTGQWAIASC